VVMAYCTRCGSTLLDGARFCERCGTPVYTGPASTATPNETSSWQAQTPQSEPLGRAPSGLASQASEVARSAIQTILREVQAPDAPGEFVLGTWSDMPASSIISTAAQAMQVVQGAGRTIQDARGAVQTMQNSPEAAPMGPGTYSSMPMPTTQNAQMPTETAQGAPGAAPAYQTSQIDQTNQAYRTQQTNQAYQAQQANQAYQADKASSRESRKPTVRYSSGKKNQK